MFVLNNHVLKRHDHRDRSNINFSVNNPKGEKLCRVRHKRTNRLITFYCSATKLDHLGQNYSITKGIPLPLGTKTNMWYSFDCSNP